MLYLEVGIVLLIKIDNLQGRKKHVQIEACASQSIRGVVIGHFTQLTNQLSAFFIHSFIRSFIQSHEVDWTTGPQHENYAVLENYVNKNLSHHNTGAIFRLGRRAAIPLFSTCPFIDSY